ncbi:hypothetical protein PVMG_04537 [Plasmodium vivax Mauritania I]|uniref:Uncharacterized protein n=1 Tax=Plasmodium vivax Mauritania I TaxID=1035515 RepID=A0A0J9T4Z7_PLAVI|nr:hypothetical protein PVMG_04537 [Plasmodium vivax Mauritania I]
MCFIFYYQYPFLDKIWNLYDEFNETTDNLNNEKEDYNGVCKVIKEQAPDKKEWYNNLCIKLIRNLGTLSFENDKTKYNSERCKNLNSWLYYIIKDHEVNQDIITNIFDESNKLMGDENIRHQCSNYLYKDKYNDPDKIIKLINLEDYMKDFLSILQDNSANNHCLCRKFIFECANIYREMNNIYCSGQTRNSSTKSDTCYQLQIFQTFFTSYVSTKEKTIGKLPSLYAKDNENIPICASDAGKQELEQGKKPELESNGADQSSSPKKIRISTAIGTMAGIPPFLALIYKVNIMYT